MEFNASTPNKGSGKDEGKSQDSPSSSDAKAIDLQFLNSVAKDFYRLLNLEEDLNSKPIDIQVTSDGMRISLFDRARKPLFKENSAEFTEWGNYMMQSMAWLIDRHKFNVVIDGHTRSGLTFTNKDYSSWELSSDRANASRRALTYYAVDPKLIERVVGYADTRPVPGEPIDSESNQRVTLSLTVGKRVKDSPANPKPALSK
jgi:chemotaxis protein MotB